MESSSSSPALRLLALVSFLCLFSSCLCQVGVLQGIDLANPVVEVAPSRVVNDLVSGGSKETIACERVQVSGISRLKLGSYASSLRVTVAPSIVIPERLHTKIQVCFHQNVSFGLCQCDKDYWKNIHKGLWTSTMSPYEERYVDIKFTGGISGSVAVTVEEDAQQWRLVCLALGFVMLLLAPILSSWVPFYYSTSMFIGVLLVVIILLFQGMKLLPAGRKSAFYMTIYGSLIGAGSFLLHHFSVMINSILVNFGLSEEIHNPVSILVLVLIVLAGAGLGYWIVRRYIVSEDGVDAGITQFVKWAMRIVGSTFILQSTLDTPLAFGALISCWIFSIALHSAKWIFQERDYSYDVGGSWLWRDRKPPTWHGRAEFLSKQSRLGKQGNLWNSPKNSPILKNSPNLRDSPIKGLISPSSGGQSTSVVDRDYYSTFHKTPGKKKFTKREWEEITEESTRQAMAELASTPEFTEWVIENANRIKLRKDDSSCESEADSSSQTVVAHENSMINHLLQW